VGSGRCDTSVQAGAVFGFFGAAFLDDLLLAYDERPASAPASTIQMHFSQRAEGGFTASVGATF
jgi:hypothetical protein